MDFFLSFHPSWLRQTATHPECEVSAYYIFFLPNTFLKGSLDFN